MEPGLSIGHITADLSSGDMSPLSSECLHNIYRGSLSSSAHSFIRIAGNRSVPGAELFLMSLIALRPPYCFPSSVGPSPVPVTQTRSAQLLNTLPRKPANNTLLTLIYVKRETISSTYGIQLFYSSTRTHVKTCWNKHTCSVKNVKIC